MIELVLFGTFFALLLLGVPVAFSLGLSAFTAIVYISGTGALSVSPSVIYAQLSAETLLAIPFFILAGTVMEFGGISNKLIEFADSIVGRLKHGLAMVVIVAAFFFSAISGSGPATVAAVGSILIPALIRRGYKVRHATSMVAAAGSMGIIIPPSIAFVIFGVVMSEYARVSIGRLFIAGIVPGILMAVALMIAAMLVPRVQTPTPAPASAAVIAGARTRGVDSVAEVRGGGGGSDFVGSEELRHLPVDAEASAAVGSGKKSFGPALLGALPGLMVPVIILGGIYGGIFTPTESAIVASVYALLVSLLFSREFGLRTMWRVFTVAAVQSAAIMLIVGAAAVFAYVITRNRIADTVSSGMLGLSDNRIVLLLLILVLLLVVGMFMDAVSALYLFVPLLAPVLLHVGVDATHIGVLVVVNLAVGLITPPVGVNLFVAAGIARAPLAETVKGIAPFLIAALVVLVLITFIPALSTWLPDLLGA